MSGIDERDGKPVPETADGSPPEATPAVSGPSAPPPASAAPETVPGAAPAVPGAGTDAADGANVAGDEGGAWAGRTAERVRGACEAARALAERTAREFHIKRTLDHTRAEKEITLKRIGEEVVAFLSERGLTHPELAAALEGIAEAKARLAAKEAEERDLESIPRPAGWIGRIKRSVARFAGYTRIRIEQSMLRNEHESKVASLGQFVYSRKDLFAPFCEPSRFIPDLLHRVESLEREIAELERGLAELD